MEDVSTKTAIIGIDKFFDMHFVFIPENYKVTKYTLEDHEIRKLGKLKSLNRVKLITHWKKGGVDLVKVFTDALIKGGWDFEKRPNPTAFLVMANCINK